MAHLVVVLWLVVLGVTVAGFFIGLGAGLGKLIMWLKGE